MIIELGERQYDIRYTDDPEIITGALAKEKPDYVAIDYETTGLHIKKDRPFIGAFGWGNTVYVFPTTKEILSHIPVWSNTVNYLYAHNALFEMYMTANVVGEEAVLKVKNWADTMCLARLSFDASSKESIALKNIGKNYIDSNADTYEQKVKSWLKAKEAQNKKILSAMLQIFGWSITRLGNAINKHIEEVPQEVLNVYTEWQKHYPKPNYQDVPREIIMPYVSVDVILTLRLIELALPVLQHRKQEAIIDREFRLLPTVFKMGYRGMAVNRSYLQESESKLEQYIQDLYIKLHSLTGEERQFRVSQHKKVKDYYAKQLGYEPKSTDKAFLNRQASNGDEVAKIITKIRRAEKWKSTYVEKILEDSAYDGRFYSSINQFIPVTGRFSGDSQQFPREYIADDEGNIIFYPRKAFVGNMAFLDYSQVELRMQAHYTLPFGGDTNLCRAYMPYKCIHYKTGEMYDYTTLEGRLRWSENQEDNEISAWIVPETGEPWVPTDVHSATTVSALDIILGEGEWRNLTKDEFSHWRNIGKRFNFMRNYGGGNQKASETLEITLEHAKALNQGYTDAFPIVVTYQNAIIQAMYKKGFVQNLYGRRYYGNQSNLFYQFGNYIIQGSCAEMLKEKMIEIDKFLTENNCGTRFLMCVHDELIFERDPHESEEKWMWTLREIKKIMEDTPNVNIPIVAGVDITTTTWADAEGINL